MALRIRSPEDFWSGLVFIGFGGVAAWVGRGYNVGTPSDMGPGFFPAWLGVILMLVGAAVTARSLWIKGEGIGRIAVRPLILLSAAFGAFGILMEPAGFVAALVAILGISVLAGDRFRALEVALLALVIVGGSVALFVYGLGLPFRVFPWD